MVKDNTFGIAPLQDKMLDILKYYINICEENNLTYWAGGGTCLGALRHGGFIPWDDDLDVFMPRPDYEKLYEIWPMVSKDKSFKLCRTTRNKNYHHRVMQIVNVNTTFINKRSIDEDIEHGVYIDIIPMDAAAPSLCGRILQAIESIIFSVYNIQTLPEFQGGKFMQFGTKVMLKFIRSNSKRYAIWRNAEKKMTKYDWDSATQAIELTTSFSSIFKPWPIEWFKTQKVPFEDIVICIPNGADEYMTAVYGNYMELPPKQEQRVKHNTVFIDIEHSYLNYKNIYYCVSKNQ